MNLNYCANQVLQEFGGVIPETLVSFEDAKRELVSVRALELNKLGVSSTDMTVTKRALTVPDRDFALPAGFGEAVIPAFARLVPFGRTEAEAFKVEILPVEKIPDYEGARTIAFYGTPMRVQVSWNSWEEGEIYLYHDPVEDITRITGATEIKFPPGFWTFLFKKTALNLLRMAQLKLAALDPAEITDKKLLFAALANFERSLGGQLVDWERQMKQFRNADFNTEPHLRRTQEEVNASSYNNVQRGSPMDVIG